MATAGSVLKGPFEAERKFGETKLSRLFSLVQSIIVRKSNSFCYVKFQIKEG
jgi:hypothetical protein